MAVWWFTLAKNRKTPKNNKSKKLPSLKLTNIAPKNDGFQQDSTPFPGRNSP